MSEKYDAKLILPAAAVFFGGILALATVAGSVPQKPTGDLVVEIASEGQKDWSELALSFRHGAGIVEKGKTTYRFSDIPPGTYTLIADASVKGGFLGKDTRLLAAAKANVKSGLENRVTVTLAAAGEIDSFCAACHPTRNEPLKSGQIVRDVHRSGAPLPKDHAEKVTAYNRETAELQKKGETKRLPMPLDEREVDSGGRKTKETFFTCESCHTFHRETPYPSYVRASYRQGGDLCMGCHP